MTTAIEEARSKTNNGSHDAVSSKRRFFVNNLYPFL